MKMTIRKIVLVVATAVTAVVQASDDLAARLYLGSIPSVSADGSFFVFEWCSRLWRAPVTGGEAVALTDGFSRDIRPALSPDARRMAFLSDRDGGWKLFEMALENTPGLAAGQIRQLSFHSEGLTPKGYTFDGRGILAVVRRDHGVGPASAFHGLNRIVTLPLDRPGREDLVFDAPGQEPALSPDGGKLLFVVRGSGLEPGYRKRVASHVCPTAGRIWLYDRSTGAFTEIIRRKTDSRFPIWTPDGTGFYYMSDEDGVRNVRHYTLKTGADRRVTAFKGDHVFAPTLSRDGGTMIVRCGFDFWRLDPRRQNPSPARIVLRAAGGMPETGRVRRRWYTSMWNNDVDGTAAFANEGKEIAFTAGGDLWVMDASFRQPVRIHGSARTHERECCFSPDGATLYYLSDRGDGVDVWKAVRADPGRAWWENTSFVRTRLTTDDVYRCRLSLSPDGRCLGWVNRTGKIFIAGTDAVVRAVSKVGAAGCSGYAWSPDARWIAASIMDAFDNYDVWILPAFDKNADGSPAPAPYNLSRHHKYDSSPVWSSDGKVLAFSGVRAKTGDRAAIFYAYLDPADETRENALEKKMRDAHEKTKTAAGTKPDGKKQADKKQADKKQSDKKAGGTGKAVAGDKGREKTTAAGRSNVTIVFDGLFERVRSTGVHGSGLFFGHEPRKLAFEANGAVHAITLPGDLKPTRLLSKAGTIRQWIKTGKGEKFLRVVNSKPAHGDETLEFKVYQETDIADYQELAFLSGWGLLRDAFCDPNMHGADWPAVKEKYRLAARHAPAWSVFNRVMQMMIGELDASHLGFWESDMTTREWNPERSRHSWTISTAHFGARYDAAYAGKGWRVADVVARSPVDRGEAGLMPGDIVTAVDGRKLDPSLTLTDVMNTPLPHTFRIEFVRKGETRTLFAEAKTYAEIRGLMRAESVRAMRRTVASRGNFGYINIEAMDRTSLNEFMDSVFAEGFGKDGLVVDVRYNHGGHIADRVLDILCGPSHSRSCFRGDAGEGYLLGYWGRPLLPALPIVVLCNWDSCSNAEIFSHAIKTLKRGKVVGTQTWGGVIATLNQPLLDMGTIRKAYIGWFTADGTDMEFNGAKPDIEIDITPEDIVKGRDPQLETAIRVLAAEAASVPKRPPLRYAK
jgi:tricorn protease